MRKLILAGAVLAVVGTGCSGLISGSTQRIMVRSNVQGEITVAGRAITPKTNEWFYLDRAHIGMPITVSREGCPSRTIDIPKRINPLLITDIVLISGGWLMAGIAGGLMEEEVGFSVAWTSAVLSTGVVGSAYSHHSWERTDKEIIINLECPEK
jgi:hypothetical protein